MTAMNPLCCSRCGQKVHLTADPTGASPTTSPGVVSDVLCRSCVEQWGQDLDAPYVVVRGGYYRKEGDAFVRIGPAGSFHG